MREKSNNKYTTQLENKLFTKNYYFPQKETEMLSTFQLDP